MSLSPQMNQPSQRGRNGNRHINSMGELSDAVCPILSAGYQSFVDAAERAPLMGPGPVSDGQFYSPPESLAGLILNTNLTVTSDLYRERNQNISFSLLNLKLLVSHQLLLASSYKPAAGL